MTEVEFGHHSAEYAESWREINADLRSRCQVAHNEAHGGYWVISRYADVAEVARDDATLSSYQEDSPYGPTGVTIPRAQFRQVPIEMDPPEFFHYRRMLNPFFSPGTAKRWEPFLREVTTFCIDRICERGSGELAHDVAGPVPAVFTMKLLGLSMRNWEFYAEAAHLAIYSPPGTPEHDRAIGGLMQMAGELMETIGRRRAEPADDPISAMVQAEVNGEPLDDTRVMEMAQLVVFGGVDTTTSLIANALEWLARNPDERTRLRENPELMPRATEEFLRYFTPTQMLSRTVTEATEVAGRRLAAKERVLISWASANYDEDVFDAPDEVRLDRIPNRHQAFGLGIHRCIGSNFARSEFQIVVTEILRRLPDYEIDHATARRYPSIGVVNGWISLPATFTPTAREGSYFSL
jgi:cytochrome P450